MLSEAESRLIGASDLPSLLGLSPWSGPVALWARIVHGWQVAGTSDMSAGHAAEDYNRALYRQATGYTLTGPAKWRHPLYEWLRCSPDDTATDTPEGRRGVELKRYNHLDGWGAPGTDAVPEDIWVQVQVQCGVALDLGAWDSPSVDVSGLLRGEHRLYSVPHVSEVYGRCLDVGERFWRDFVVPQRCPEGPSLMLLERDAEAVRALWPRPSEDAAPLEWGALSPEQQDTVSRWLESNAQRKRWEAEEKTAAEQVRFLLREWPGLALPDGRRIDHKANAPSPKVDLKAFRVALKSKGPGFRRRAEALLKQCTKHESARPLVARGVDK